jgi:hypothetical protein
LGAGASKSTTPLADVADTLSAAEEDIHNAISMAAAIAQIGVAQDALTTLTEDFSLYTTMGSTTLEPGVHSGRAVSIDASSIITFKAPQDTSTTNHVWVINLTEALTVGAGTVFVTVVPKVDTATIIWNVAAAVTQGAGTEFIGTAFVAGAFSAATSDVSCGNIYATGAVSVGSIGAVADGSGLTHLGDPVACDTNANGLAGIEVESGALSKAAVATCPYWTSEELEVERSTQYNSKSTKNDAKLIFRTDTGDSFVENDLMEARTKKYVDHTGSVTHMANYILNYRRKGDGLNAPRVKVHFMIEAEHKACDIALRAALKKRRI